MKATTHLQFDDESTSNIPPKKEKKPKKAKASLSVSDLSTLLDGVTEALNQQAELASNDSFIERNHRPTTAALAHVFTQQWEIYVQMGGLRKVVDFIHSDLICYFEMSHEINLKDLSCAEIVAQFKTFHATGTDPFSKFPLLAMPDHADYQRSTKCVDSLPTKVFSGVKHSPAMSAVPNDVKARFIIDGLQPVEFKIIAKNIVRKL